jgi:hypothetical protein
LTLQEIQANLTRTIAGKDRLLQAYKEGQVPVEHPVVHSTMIQMLEINLRELRAILADVEKVIDAG